MLSKKMFDLLNYLGKALRPKGMFDRPFGGIQLVFSGDFFQLPPIGEHDDVDSQKFCFESVDWFTTFRREQHIRLHRIFRQKDEVYCRILNQIRSGVLKKSSLDHLMRCVNKPRDPKLLIEPTHLYPVRSAVEELNQSRMAALPGEVHTFRLEYLVDSWNPILGIGGTGQPLTKQQLVLRAQFSREDIQKEVEWMANSLLCDVELNLKIGAQVMCVVNIPYPPPQEGLMVCNGSQGIVTGFLQSSGAPIVSFNHGTTMTMEKNVWSSDKIPGVGVSQVPLILAWALTIHKSQGATLDAAEIDAGRSIFECGQTYVALSRVKSLEGLYLTAFHPQNIKINRQVKEFYDTLESKHISLSPT
jgi:ATP-dependent DNA helicase PIF1